MQVKTRPFHLQNYCQKWATESTRQARFPVQRGARPCKGFTVKFRVVSNVYPILCKHSSIPHALRGRVEDELNRLVACGVLEPVQLESNMYVTITTHMGFYLLLPSCSSNNNFQMVKAIDFYLSLW